MTTIKDIYEKNNITGLNNNITDSRTKYENSDINDSSDSDTNDSSSNSDTNDSSNSDADIMNLSMEKESLVE